MPNNLQLAVSGESLDRKHEVSERSVRNVLIVGAGTAFLLIFSLAASALTIHLLANGHRMQQMASLGIIIAPNLKPFERFPAPNLQIDDGHAQMTALYAEQNRKLNSYGWVDRSNGVVRIPIERAMDLIVQRGLPARTNGISQTGASRLQLIQERPKQR